MMNHPSEWVKFFVERAGRYRYKHKGSGVVRDTLMTIGKVFKSGATKAVKSIAKKGHTSGDSKSGPETW